MPAGIRLPLLGLLGAGLAGTARAQAPVPLGGAEPFAVLAGTAVNNAGATIVTGDLGVSPGSTITAKALAAGRHTIKAVSRDAAGNKRVKKARFNRCVRGIAFTG